MWHQSQIFKVYQKQLSKAASVSSCCHLCNPHLRNSWALFVQPPAAAGQLQSESRALGAYILQLWAIIYGKYIFHRKKYILKFKQIHFPICLYSLLLQGYNLNQERCHIPKVNWLAAGSMGMISSWGNYSLNKMWKQPQMILVSTTGLSTVDISWAPVCRSDACMGPLSYTFCCSKGEEQQLRTNERMREGTNSASKSSPRRARLSVRYKIEKGLRAV